MSREYYYFVATLPSIYFDSKAPMKTESFLDDCDYQLSPRDSGLVRDLLEGDPTQNNVTEACALWTDFNNMFKNQMSCCRAKKMGKDPYSFMRGERTSSAELEALTIEALKEDNLIDGERAIDKRYWEYLDELEGPYFFDLTNIIVYGLKLKILEKYNRIASEEGAKILEEYKNIEMIKGAYSER